jgi:hypothetical protein
VAAARRPPGHDRGRQEGEKEEGDEGVLLPHSPWVEAARGEGSTGGGVTTRPGKYHTIA